ncbi:MAG: sigma-70 family RNA polymerase sigma factor [Gemmataceae bacterium]|nr:sigma-70 family RNA polymerase sigma factor [Gemmataceae bacterium]
MRFIENGLAWERDEDWSAVVSRGCAEGGLMEETEFSTAVLQDYLCRWRAGEQAALNELLRRVFRRLEQLASRMLRSFPNIRPLIDSDDLLQNSVVRFVRTLQTIRPATTRDFFNLAAVHMRREMIDLARQARRRITAISSSSLTHRAMLPEPVSPDSLYRCLEDFDLWVRFHEAVDNLPLEEREVVGLIFYHGWKQQEIAELFNVSVRTVRRRWVSACERLRRMISTDQSQPQ